MVPAIIVLLAFVLAWPAPGRAENVLRWASTTEAVTFDPNAAYLAPTIAENHQVYEGLVDLNARYELETLARDGLAPPRSPHLGVRAAPGRHLPRRRAVHARGRRLQPGTGRLRCLAVQGFRAADRVGGGRR